MPISELLWEGAILMLLGMGMVITFLTILVLAMYLMSLLAQHLSDDSTLPASLAAAASPPLASSGEDELTAVITAAIRRYRSDRN